MTSCLDSRYPTSGVSNVGSHAWADPVTSYDTGRTRIIDARKHLSARFDPSCGQRAGRRYSPRGCRETLTPLGSICFITKFIFHFSTRIHHLPALFLSEVAAVLVSSRVFVAPWFCFAAGSKLNQRPSSAFPNHFIALLRDGQLFFHSRSNLNIVRHNHSCITSTSLCECF